MDPLPSTHTHTPQLPGLGKVVETQCSRSERSPMGTSQPGRQLEAQRILPVLTMTWLKPNTECWELHLTGGVELTFRNTVISTPPPGSLQREGGSVAWHALTGERC